MLFIFYFVGYIWFTWLFDFVVFGGVWLYVWHTFLLSLIIFCIVYSILYIRPKPIHKYGKYGQCGNYGKYCKYGEYA